MYDQVIDAFKENGAFYTDDESDVEKFRKALFNEKGVFNREAVGQSVQKVSRLAGVEIPDGTAVILLKAKGAGREDILCRE